MDSSFLHFVLKLFNFFFGTFIRLGILKYPNSFCLVLVRIKGKLEFGLHSSQARGSTIAMTPPSFPLISFLLNDLLILTLDKVKFLHLLESPV